jgi:hypothetical protein
MAVLNEQNDRYDEFMAGLEAQAEEQGVEVDELLAELLKGKPYIDKYNGTNPARVFMQDPEASDVRGFVQWQEAGRAVTAGAEAIWILAGGKRDDKDKDAKDAEPGTGKQPGEISSEDLKPKRGFFALAKVFDVRFTEPTVCATCGEPVHRTGLETKAEMKARNGRKQAALWTHSTVKPADGHKAVRLWAPKTAAAPAA